MNSSLTPSTHHQSRGTTRLRLILVAVLVSLAVGSIVVMRKSNKPSIAGQSVAVGKPAPRIDLIELATISNVVPASIKLENKVTLLHLWGTWCGPCRMEYPELTETVAAFSDNDAFQFVPVSCEGGQGETFEGLWKKTSEYFQSENIISVAYADPRGLTRRSLAERLDQANLYFPTSILIDQSGRIAGVWEGYSPEAIDEIASLIDSLLHQ
ncbi:Thiol:disulfide interchange protein DsbE [Rubripirellula amarantea]|uniref:Thiol:disulfide interchange protein DsbE n=1 Tax=Rubripirellula amarantea TaxID=2527999 RepID=A0A5C5WV51_9BACT|nr:TlpA disulfide reductase family protein [Rubripirellula amarantea]TWT53702.1 Thiol:disulfide interchange protein DsbE [Rubripirellula amarantea]